MDFKGKTVLITGASRGIGHACATQFQQYGATVIVAQRSQSQDFQSIAIDLGDLTQVAGLIEQVIVISPKIDVLVNNAGIMSESQTEDLALKDWQRTLDINLTVPFLLTKYALPYLKQTKGSIVNISSIEALGSNPLHAAYCASKAGLLGLTRSIAVDYGKYGVRCNAVAPGWIETELNQTFVDSQNDPRAFREKIADIHPLARTGDPHEVANLVCFLSSKQASFITGQTYTVDGGRTCQLSLPQT